MRTILASALSALLCGPCIASDPAEYIAMIRQHQTNLGVTWDMPVELIGEGLSPLAVVEGGALFELWAIHEPTVQDFLVDQKLVGAWVPRVELTIISKDSFPNTVRTRADQPITVQLKVSGLLSGFNAPLETTKVLFEHYATAYPDDTMTLTREQVLAGTPVDSIFVDANGTFQFEYLATSIAGADPTNVAGEEHFMVSALGGVDFEQSQIDSSSVQIWPVAEGSIEGLADGEVVGIKSPDLTLDLNDLYPSSSTYLQVYSGSPALGTVGAKVIGSVLVLNQDKPEERTLVVKNWANSLGLVGQYTMELLTQTPFGIDRLDYVTFSVDRTLKVRAMVTSLE